MSQNAKRPDQSADVDQRQFLELLFKDALGNYLEGFADLRAIKPDGTEKDVDRESVKLGADTGLTNVIAAIRRLEKKHPGWNVYIGVATRTKRGAGGKKDLHSTQVIFSEIDRYGEDPSGKDLATIDLLYYPPSVVVASGGGEHLYWRLREPLDLRQPKNVERYEAILSGVTHAIGADRNSTDASRILRPPGTTNYPDRKKKAKGRTATKEVRLTRADADVVYPIDAYAEFEEIGRSLKSTSGDERASYEHRDWAESEPPPRVAEILVTYPNVRARYDGNTDGLEDASDSGVDMSLACHLARFGCEGWEIEAALRMSREKRGAKKSPEQKGDDYFVRTVERALAWWEEERQNGAHEAFGAPNGGEHHAGAAPGSGARPHFELNQFKKPAAGSQTNMVLAIEALGVRLRYDEFADRGLITRGGGPEETLGDALATNLWLEIERQYGFRPPKEVFWAVVEDLAWRNRFHPVREYLDALAWDGKRRIHCWLPTYGGATDSAYVRAVGAHVLVAAVRRVRHPGAKFDEMLVLESEQGTEKSTSIEALCPRKEWFADDLPIGVDAKQVIERTVGKWLVEAGELSGMRKGEVEKVKAFMSRGSDGPTRLSYDRISTERPRHFVVIGTTNDAAYLKDSTGNRRFWPVRVDRFDLDALRRDRDQLWAEAARLEAEGASIRLSPKLWRAAGAEQEERRVTDAWEGVLEERLGAKDDEDRLDGKLLVDDAWWLIGKSDPGVRGQHDNERLGKAIRQLGFERWRGRLDGKPRTWYVRFPAGENDSADEPAGETDPSKLVRLVVEDCGARVRPESDPQDS